MKSKILWQYTAILFLSIIFTSCKKEISQTEKVRLAQDEATTNSLVVTCIPSSTQFLKTESLSQARGVVPEGIGLNNKVLIIGGIKQNSSLSRHVDIYNTTSDSWTHKILSEANFAQAFAASGTKIGIAGGFAESSNALSDRVDIYDVNSDAWTVSHLSSARQAIAGVGYGNFLYFAGGADSKVRKTIDVYNTLNGSWTKLNLSIARMFVAAAATNNKILFAGGETSDGRSTDRVDIYDVPTATWSVSAISQARSQMVGAAAGNLIIFGGGSAIVGNGTGESFNIIDIYNTTTGLWSVSHLSSASGWHQSAVQRTKMFFGGNNSVTSAPSKIDVYDICLNSWSKLSLSDGRGAFAAGAAGGKVLFAGGRLNDDFVKTVDIFRVGVPLAQ